MQFSTFHKTLVWRLLVFGDVGYHVAEIQGHNRRPAKQFATGTLITEFRKLGKRYTFAAA